MNLNNFIFDVNKYKHYFAPLKHINPNDYQFIIDLVTIGADIKRSEIPPPKSNPNYPIHGSLLIEKVTEKLLLHLKQGHFRGPYFKNQLPLFKYKIHTSPIAAKLKASGKPMILVDESAPKCHNINSVIEQADKTVTYASFIDLCYLLKRIGNRGWIWIVDAVDAYYRIPIQKRFHHLFGIEWLGKILIYKCLSFGLSTAPSIYNKFADLFVWLCIYYHRPTFKCKNKFNILHYLDDFFGGHTSYDTALRQMNILKNFFEILNVPTNDKKCVGPAQTIIILGWKCTTFPFVAIGLPDKKITKYIEFLLKIKALNSANLKQFEKLIGYTVHICSIFFNAKCFVRGFTKQKCSLLKQVEDSTSKLTKFTPIYLSPESLFDLDLWIQLLKNAKNTMINIDFILETNPLNTIHVYTDASTSYGFGGYDTLNQLYHLPLSSLNVHKTNLFFKLKHNLSADIQDHIIYLEIFAAVLFAAKYAHTWHSKLVIFYCDNRTAVKALNKGVLDFNSILYYPKANLIKYLATLALKYKFKYKCKPIDGECNKIADTLSRNNDLKRQLVYNHFKQNHVIPSKLASKILNITCMEKFCASFKI